MKLQTANGSNRMRRSAERGSVLVIVLLMAIGLITMVLYFANSMTMELRAADNRASTLAADQAIEGAARYITSILNVYSTNGAVPDPSEYQAAAVPMGNDTQQGGNAHFWIIGRDPSGTPGNEPYFALVDEGSKLNLNSANTNALSYLPNMTSDFAQAIQDWRGTNGSGSLNYASLGYQAKNAPFESVDELHLVYGATMSLLVGDDANRNGVLDANEQSLSGNGQTDRGLFDYVTVYSREPNFHSDGTSLTNVNTVSQSDLASFFQADGVSSASSMAPTIYQTMNPPPPRPANPCTGILDFAIRCRGAGMSLEDFAKIYDDATTTTNSYFHGRVNINTAGVDVLTALITGLNVDEQTAASAAQSLVTYRQQNPNSLTSVAWVYDALGNGNSVLTALQGGDYITAHSFQFSADVAAVGPFGRGYKRVRFVFDTSDGTPKILFREDLSRLGWALGTQARQTWVVQNTR